ncbi:hypothetical protein HYFRA_00013446 [Hymenoscyphus fraxineus]|uniref:Pinin/SDK/MemA protein domain-containing protein n=1 Tax=Hymenoscyphus fraxineus TaxID=746836 RepID=A0A9N9L9W1_9HELO|nr:hypothetical protein HYFRA_00013446 [Hymenoscyphus fraxineus]
MPCFSRRIHILRGSRWLHDAGKYGSHSPIASAVVLPDPEPQSVPEPDQAASQSPSIKRRQSTDDGQPSKRPRISQELNATSPTQISPKAKLEEPVEKKLSDPAQDRRKSRVQEEKKRGQRLFGGLLSTLSQSTSNGQQKRRQEIEKRQQERAKQQKAEDETRRARKRESILATRKVEQIKYDEASMKTRHSNMLAMAHSLCTTTEPKLYYKPWELLPQEEERIKVQVAEAENNIRREEEDFYARHPELSRRRSSIIDKANITSTETVGEPQHEPPSVSKAIDTTNDNPAKDTEAQVISQKQSSDDHNSEVVVENEEDTVIY